MPISKDDLLQHLPALRRYARAFTGSKDEGDAAVARAVARALQSPTDAEGGVKIGLYTELSRALVGHDGAEVATATGLAADLATLAAVPRQVLLLTELEGFPVATAARILGIGEADADAMLADARGRLKQAAATDILIIEDEYLIAMDIQELVRSCGHNVVGVAATRAEAVELAARRKPGLILADVNLGPGGSGQDAVADILASTKVPVIFVTAYPERLLTGKGPEPAFVITKPFDPMTLAVTTFQAISSDQRRQASQ